jgi:hypothetical protein
MVVVECLVYVCAKSVHKALALTLNLYTTVKLTAINKAEFKTCTPNINGG